MFGLKRILTSTPCNISNGRTTGIEVEDIICIEFKKRFNIFKSKSITGRFLISDWFETLEIEDTNGDLHLIEFSRIESIHNLTTNVVYEGELFFEDVLVLDDQTIIKNGQTVSLEYNGMKVSGIIDLIFFLGKQFLTISDNKKGTAIFVDLIEDNIFDNLKKITP